MKRDKTFTLKLPLSLHTRLKMAAVQKGKTINSFVCDVIDKETLKQTEHKKEVEKQKNYL